MKIVVVSGSMRPDSQSLKVSQWLVDHGKQLGVDMELLDLHTLELPQFTTKQPKTEAEQRMLALFDSADGAVFVSPEWDGMMSHGIPSMLHYIDNELAHKPVMLAGISSTRGGHYPLMQMRTMGYKNKHYIITPESLLVQWVKDAFNDHDMSDDAQDAPMKKRANYGLKILIEYAKALHAVRDSGAVDFEQFPNGV